MRERLLAAAIGLVLLGGVAGAMTTDDESTAASGAPAPELEAGPVGDRTEWVLRFLNQGEQEDLDAVFAPAFLAQVPAEQVIALADRELRPLGPYEIESILEESATEAVLILRGATGAAWRMSIAVVGDRITSLLLQPYQDDRSKPGSWDELERRLRDAAPDMAFLAAEVVDGECRPVHAIDADRVLPLGSAFKLYVLGAAADAVAAGTASWDDMLTITDERRVHSSMTYGETAAGTQVSLRDAAQAMISVSDNTATDLVLEHVGRAAVEAQLPIMGMADPSRNLPFLSTRELTFVKWVFSDEERQEYIDADVERRRAILDALPDRGATLEDLSDLASGPVAVDELEWFASPLDLCRAHVALQTKGDEVRRILSLNRGVDIDRDRFPYVAFKGGSEPGVLAGAWYAEMTDGRKRFVAALLMNEDAEVASTILLDVAAAFDLFD
ncbi:MAG TPA: serine hydrolase [Acidimicrobiales bacterium]|nr:serine hydrolase [Acidimicrobiales bacterium]